MELLNFILTFMNTLKRKIQADRITTMSQIPPALAIFNNQFIISIFMYTVTMQLMVMYIHGRRQISPKVHSARKNAPHASSDVLNFSTYV